MPRAKQVTEAVSGALEALRKHVEGLTPQPGMFSTLDEQIKEAPFEQAPISEWKKYLQPGRMLKREGAQFPLKKEEIDYSGLDELDKYALPHTVLTKEEVRGHIRGHRPMFNTTIGRDDTVEDLVLEGTDRVRITESEYGPGAGDETLSHQSAGSMYEESITGMKGIDERSHFNPDTLSWSRTSTHAIPQTQAEGGYKVRLVEEIQSDLHQRAGKKVLEDPNTGMTYRSRREAMGDLDEEGMERIVERRRGYKTEDTELESYDVAAQLEDLNTEVRAINDQLDINRSAMDQEHPASVEHRRLSGENRELLDSRSNIMGQMAKLEKVESQLNRLPQQAPFKNPSDYAGLELRKQLMNAVENEEDYLALVRGRDQIERYELGMGEKESAGMRHIYDKVYRKELEKLGKRYGAEIVDVEVPALRTAQDVRTPFMVRNRWEAPHEMLEDVWDDIHEGTNYQHVEHSIEEIEDFLTDFVESLDTLNNPDNKQKIADALGFDVEVVHRSEQYDIETPRKAIDNVNKLFEQARKLFDEDSGEALVVDSPAVEQHLEETMNNISNVYMELGRQFDDMWGMHKIVEGGRLADAPGGKTFPAIKLTPEIREKIKKVGVPLWGMAAGRMMMGEEEEKGYAEGGKVEREEDEEEKYDPEGLERLKELITAPFDYLSFPSVTTFGPPSLEEAAESREQTKEDVTRVLSGMAQNWMTLNPQTGQAELRMPPRPLPPETLAFGLMEADDYEKASAEMMSQPFRPGIVDEIAMMPGLVGVDAKWSKQAGRRAERMLDNVKEQLELGDPEGFRDHLMQSAGFMISQAPIPLSFFKKLKELASAAPALLKPVAQTVRMGSEFLSPVITPSAASYGGGTLFGGGLGTLMDEFFTDEERKERDKMRKATALIPDPDLPADLAALLDTYDAE